MCICTYVFIHVCDKKHAGRENCPPPKNIHKGKAVKVVNWEFVSGTLQKVTLVTVTDFTVNTTYTPISA